MEEFENMESLRDYLSLQRKEKFNSINEVARSVKSDLAASTIYMSFCGFERGNFSGLDDSSSKGTERLNLYLETIGIKEEDQKELLANISKLKKESAEKSRKSYLENPENSFNPIHGRPSRYQHQKLQQNAAIFPGIGKVDLVLGKNWEGVDLLAEHVLTSNISLDDTVYFAEILIGAYSGAKKMASTSLEMFKELHQFGGLLVSHGISSKIDALYPREESYTGFLNCQDTHDALVTKLKQFGVLGYATGRVVGGLLEETQKDYANSISNEREEIKKIASEMPNSSLEDLSGV